MTTQEVKKYEPETQEETVFDSRPLYCRVNLEKPDETYNRLEATTQNITFSLAKKLNVEFEKQEIKIKGKDFNVHFCLSDNGLHIIII
jgi:hypothetical protein